MYLDEKIADQVTCFVIRVEDHTHARLSLVNATSAIGMDSDFVKVMWYGAEYDSSMLEWFKSRQICSRTALEILEGNLRMWKDPRWGIGRDLVPLLILNPQELSTLLWVPDDPSLALRYKR